MKIQKKSTSIFSFLFLIIINGIIVSFLMDGLNASNSIFNLLSLLGGLILLIIDYFTLKVLYGPFKENFQNDTESEFNDTETKF